MHTWLSLLVQIAERTFATAVLLQLWDHVIHAASACAQCGVEAEPCKALSGLSREARADATAAVQLLRDRDDSAAARRFELPHARGSQAGSHGRAARSS
eukprot:3146377-Prymnesium_polylepis.1